MMSNQEEPQKNIQQRKELNRRELLKILAATGGALGASTFLPAQWTKPVIEAGVLPAHAQTSQPRPQVTTAFATTNSCTFTYHDPLCEADGSTRVFAWIHGCSETILNGVFFKELVVDGNTCQGKVEFSYETNCKIEPGVSLLCVRLEIGHRQSQALCPKVFEVPQ